jgi:hypothetical protein
MNTIKIFPETIRFPAASLKRLNTRLFSSSLQNNPFQEKEEINHIVSDDYIVNKYKSVNGDYTSKFMNHLLDSLYLNYGDGDKISNEEIQKRMESIILNEFDVFYSNNKLNYSKNGINHDILVPPFIKYLLEKEELIKDNIVIFKKFYKDKKSSRLDQMFIAEILSVVNSAFISNVCMSHFLLVYTYQKSDNDKYYNLINVSITMANKLLNRYFNCTRDVYMKENDTSISYSL